MTKDKPLGLGLIGCGSFGRFCLAVFSKMDEVRVAAVADVRKSAADDLARAFGVPAFYDPAKLIAQDDVDIVHVATPPSSHFELVMSAARAGKCVLCEKPLATNTAHADEMLAAARNAGVIAPVNFILRYNAVTDIVKRVLDSGVLGKPLAARLTNCATDGKLAPEHWFWDKSVSGGIFIEHGGHFFDLYNYWLGPGEVINARSETREGTAQEDRVTCTVRHLSADVGAIVSHYHAFDQPTMMDRADHRIICELGEVRVEGWIPLTIGVDAVVDDAGQAGLAECMPDCDIEVVEEYDGAAGATMGRGRQRHVARRIRCTCTPNGDKGKVYSAGVRALLADQIAYIRDPSHKRVVTEQNGRGALAMGETAARLAGKKA